jgi:hypothetical protein
MALLKLEKAKWRTFFDRVSKRLIGKRAEIDVESLALGAQVEAKWLPLVGIVYDPKSDIIEIALDDLDHLIHTPRTVYVDEESTGLISLEVVGSDGVQHIVQFRDPLMLPPPKVSEKKASFAAKQDR